MKIYRLKMFNIATFTLSYPTLPGGFIDEGAAKAYCEAHNDLKEDLYYDYDEMDLSDISAEDMKKSLEEATKVISEMALVAAK